MFLHIRAQTNPPLPQTVITNAHGSLVFEENPYTEHTMDLWDNHPSLIDLYDPLFVLPFTAPVEIVTPDDRGDTYDYQRINLIFSYGRRVQTGYLYHKGVMDSDDLSLITDYVSEWFQAVCDGLVVTTMYDTQGREVASTYHSFSRNEEAKSLVSLHGEIICSTNEEIDLFNLITQGV